MEYAVKCILVKGDQLLLVKHTKDKENNFWIFPGGKINKNEDPESCVKREMKEELGLAIKTLEYIGEMPNIWENRKGLLYCFVCQVTEGKIVTNKEEIREIKWFLRDKLPVLGPTSTKILKMWVKNKL